MLFKIVSLRCTDFSVFVENSCEYANADEMSKTYQVNVQKQTKADP